MYQPAPHMFWISYGIVPTRSPTEAPPKSDTCTHLKQSPEQNRPHLHPHIAPQSRACEFPWTYVVYCRLTCITVSVYDYVMFNMLQMHERKKGSQDTHPQLFSAQRRYLCMEFGR